MWFLRKNHRWTKRSADLEFVIYMSFLFIRLRGKITGSLSTLNDYDCFYRADIFKTLSNSDPSKDWVRLRLKMANLFCVRKTNLFFVLLSSKGEKGLRTSEFRVQSSEFRVQTLGTSLPIFLSLLSCTNMDVDVSRFLIYYSVQSPLFELPNKYVWLPRSGYRHSFCSFSVKDFERN